MSSSDEDINISLGPAERDPGDKRPAAKPTRAAAPPAAKPATGGKPGGGPGLLTRGVLVLLVVACGGLGYGLLELQNQLKSRDAQLQQATAQLAELQELLQVAESSAAESGQSLVGQLGQLKSSLAEKSKHYDSEIAKLWTVAYQRNKPTLEAHDKTLAELDKKLAGQDKQLAALDKQLKAQQGELAKVGKSVAAVDQAAKSVAGLDAAQKKLAAEQAALNKSSDAAIGDLKKRLTSLDGELQRRANLLAEQQTVLSDSLKQLQQQQANARDDRASTAVSDELQRRIAINEEAIQAFDGSRRQLNRELLQIRQKLNNLQLKLEQVAR
ncbi:hypothetical protein [Marinobacterium arenosum]|uniref:hypothetical protein n=1 Tax=Marinobacterium arenosum TaxID=2862496 RepID=UPI001C98AB42|nr:hypothetical protein [Marinobacterium arenosum]MBY4678618.1 hypothetical protein [Marinobacterium arenosum]